MKHFLSKVPLPTAGVSLGLAALGNLLQPMSDIIRGICGVLSFLLILLVILKIIYCFNVAREEFKNPVVASVFAAFFMAIMQLTNYIEPYIPMIAFTIWTCAVIGHVLLIIHISKRMVMNFNLSDIFPTYFVTYVGIIVASITSVAFNLEWLGRIIFIFGFGAYIVMFVLVTYRYFKHEIHESLKPLFCLYTAPMSLSIVGYMSVFEQKSIMFVFVMVCIAQLLFLIVLTQLPKFIKSKFYPSFAALTFPFVITVTALKQVVYHIDRYYSAPNWMMYLLVIETIIAVLLVLFALAHYLIHLHSHLPHRRKRLEQGNEQKKLEN